MNVLHVNFIIVFLGSILLLFKRLGRKSYFILVTVSLIFFNGLRSIDVGVDLYRYKRHFFRVINASSLKEFYSSGSTLGYRSAEKIFEIFSSNFNCWLLFVSIFIYISLGKVIYKNSKGVLLSYIIYITLGFYEFSFTGLKQSIAFIIILNSYEYIIKKQLKKYTLICLLAASFHYTAFIFYPVYFLEKIKISKKKLMIVSIIWGLMLIFNNKIGRLLTMYYYADNSDEILVRYTSSGRIGMMTIFIMLILIWGYIFYNPIKYNGRENTLLFKITILSLFFQMLSSFSYLFTRINMYFMIFLIIYIPLVIQNYNMFYSKRFKKKEVKLLKIASNLIIIFILTLYYLKMIKIDGASILPYSFFWQ